MWKSQTMDGVSWIMISNQPADVMWQNSHIAPQQKHALMLISSKNVVRWACTRRKASINDCMGGTDIVCRLHYLVNENYHQELGSLVSQDGEEIAGGRIACLGALSSIFAKWVNRQQGIVCYERGWHPETEAIVLVHQMALRQLLLRFWVTDHGDCHFREESLEKVTVLTCKGRVTSLNLVLQACSTRYWVSK